MPAGLLARPQSRSEKIAILGIVREPGWLYYFDLSGRVMRSHLLNPRAPETRAPEIVTRTSIIREEDYIYFIDRDGDVARLPIQSSLDHTRRASKKKTATKKVKSKRKKMIKRYFECKTDGNNKFWEISWTPGSSGFTTRWGRIGTSGSTKQKDFSSTRECSLAQNKLIAEKLNKGYKEIFKTKPETIQPNKKENDYLELW